MGSRCLREISSMSTDRRCASRRRWRGSSCRNPTRSSAVRSRVGSWVSRWMRNSEKVMASKTDTPRRTHRSQAERTADMRSEEHTSELQSLMRISYAVFCLKKKKQLYNHDQSHLYKDTPTFTTTPQISVTSTVR